MDELRDIVPAGWRATTDHYPCQDYRDLPTAVVPIAEIEPPMRDEGIALFNLPRLRELAQGLVAGSRILPIEVGPSLNVAYRYRVLNGFHRFYLCRYFGYKEIPTVLIDD
jgi:hypothetical protein